MTNKPVDLGELIELAKGTPYENLAKDERALERQFLDALKASADPMLREIGTGIADGSMTWHTVATHSAYADFVKESLAKAKEFDGSVLVEELGREREKVSEARRRTEPDGSEDMFQGGVLKKRKR